MQPKDLSPESRFGQKVAELLEAQGITQRAFATKLTTQGLPLDASAVSRLLAGKRALRLSEIYIIASALDTSIHSLLPDPVDEQERLEEAKRNARQAIRLLNSFCVQVIAAGEEVDYLERGDDQPQKGNYLAEQAALAEQTAAEEIEIGARSLFTDFWFVDTPEARSRLIDSLTALIKPFIVVNDGIIDDEGRVIKRRGLGRGIADLIPQPSGDNDAVDDFFPMEHSTDEDHRARKEQGLD